MLNSNSLILVTGASGFIGSHLTTLLLTKGFKVRAIYWKNKISSRIKLDTNKHLEECQADLTNKSDINRIVKGCDIIIHAAGLAFDWGPFEDFKNKNYNATVNLVDAAQNAGCKTFVYISSIAVHGFGSHVDTNEKGPYYKLKSPYPITKMMAEKYVLKKNTKSFSTIAIRPGNVYGPGDKTSTYTMFKQIRKGVMGYIGGGNFYTCPIYIDDLCEGIFAALFARNIAGQVINLTDGDKVKWKDYIKRMFEVSGSQKRPVNLPVFAAYFSAFLFKIIFDIFRIKHAPPLTFYRVEQASHHYHFSNTKAKILLGFSPTVSYKTGLKLTAKAFLEDTELSR